YRWPRCSPTGTGAARRPSNNPARRTGATTATSAAESSRRAPCPVVVAPSDTDMVADGRVTADNARDHAGGIVRFGLGAGGTELAGGIVRFGFGSSSGAEGHDGAHIGSPPRSKTAA